MFDWVDGDGFFMIVFPVRSLSWTWWQRPSRRQRCGPRGSLWVRKDRCQLHPCISEPGSLECFRTCEGHITVILCVLTWGVNFLVNTHGSTMQLLPTITNLVQSENMWKWYPLLLVYPTLFLCYTFVALARCEADCGLAWLQCENLRIGAWHFKFKSEMWVWRVTSPFLVLAWAI